MDGTSWLLTRLGLVWRKDIEESQATTKFELQELHKEVVRLKHAQREAQEKYDICVEHLTQANDDVRSFEADCLKLEEAKVLAVAQLENLKEEVSYLREEIKIYQRRLGLLPQERQGETDKKESKPLRSARLPFAIAQAKIQTERTEAYWRAKADAVELGAGTTGKTSETTPTLSDKDS